MTETRQNLILIGMPGAGKSTTGVILAKRLGLHFIDTDLVLQAQENCRLQQIIDQQGLEVFRQLEEQILLGLHAEACVIATGGSVVYSPEGMAAIALTGRVVYLQVGLAQLEGRIADMGQRGLVMGKGQSFSELYAERVPLYEQYADVTIACDDLSAEQAAAAAEQEILRRWPEFSA